MKLEQRQHQVHEFENQLGDATPKPRRATTPRRTSIINAAAKPAPTLSCNTISQSLLLYSGSVRHIALNVPVNLTFQRSPAYAFDISVINDTCPWYELLATTYPFLHASHLHLTITWDAKEHQHLEPYFDWPDEWLGLFANVNVELLATEAVSLDIKQRIEVVVNKLVGDRRKNGMTAIWNVEPLFEQPSHIRAKHTPNAV